jgi:hypothetical protein
MTFFKIAFQNYGASEGELCLNIHYVGWETVELEKVLGTL